MGLSYAGVDLLLPTAELQVWVDRYLSLEHLQPFGCEPVAVRSSRTGSRPQAKANIGLPRPNYTPAPAPRINTLWWPTGAARWARGYFLATAQQLEAIKLANYSSGETSQPKPLVIGDAGQATVTAAQMWMLPPRQMASAGDLWLLTLVDSRYWWQFSNTSFLNLTKASTWADLFGVIATALGTTLVHSSPHAEYLNVDKDELTRPYDNVAVLFDAIASSVGKRVVFGLNGTIAAQLASESAVALAANESSLTWTLSAGATYHASIGNRPEYVRVTFPKMGNLVPFSNGVTFKVDTSIGGTTGTYKTIHSTAWADFTPDPDVADPDNNEALSALAQRIASDYAGWLVKKYDLNFNGVFNWVPSGFDDWALYSHGSLNSDGSYQASTRVTSMPWDFGVEQQLSQSSGIKLGSSPLWGYLNEPLAQGDSAGMSVCFFKDNDEQVDSGVDIDIWDTLLNVGEDDYDKYTRVQAAYSEIDSRWILTNANCKAESYGALPQVEATLPSSASGSSGNESFEAFAEEEQFSDWYDVFDLSPAPLLD